MSRNARLALVAGFILAVVAAFAIAKSGGDSKKSSPTTVTAATTTAITPTGTTTAPAPPPKPAVPVVVVRNGKPTGGIKKINARVGERVTFVVRSDVSDEIHLHGYDLTKDVKAGGSVTFSFKAKIDGIFVIELEQRAEQIGELEVQP